MAERRAERASASVLAVGLVGIVLVLLAGALLLAEAATGSARAATAADQAALAVAAEVASGADQRRACALGARIAELNASRLAGCAVTEGVATVTAQSAVRLPDPLPPWAVAVARAGPERDP